MPQTANNIKANTKMATLLCGALAALPAVASGHPVDGILAPPQHAVAAAFQNDINDPGDLRPEARTLLEALAQGNGPQVIAPGAKEPRLDSLLETFPSTIRVWRRSLGTGDDSCQGLVQELPLEDYVKGVLPHEWVASWSPEAVRAGAVAVRSYAVFWKLKGGKYTCADVCDTVYSQIYKETTHPASNLAVDYTRGQLVTKEGRLVFTEYGTEHGPSFSYQETLMLNGVPFQGGETHLIQDPVCAGKTKLGHGRGMCQYGSNRWAQQGRSYSWILNHYYPGSTLWTIGTGPINSPPNYTPPEGAFPSNDAVPGTGFTGDACANRESCASGMCITEERHDFPGGSCTEDCTNTPGNLCSDQSGKALTFCVTANTASGTRGLCLSRCDYGIFPGSGCRFGYVCSAPVRRFNHDEVREPVCVPQWAAGKMDDGSLTVAGPPLDDSTMGGCSMSSSGAASLPIPLLLLGLGLLLGLRRRSR